MPNNIGSKLSLLVSGGGGEREKEEARKLNFLKIITFIKIMEKRGFGLTLPLWFETSI